MRDPLSKSLDRDIFQFVPEKRRRHMAAVKGKNTKPELTVRRAAHALGYRFRLHGKGLPGKPDLVFARRRKVIFVHGCFWHRHGGCKRTTTPATRADFWQAKFARNVERDAHNISELKAMGWHSLVIWECETFEPAALHSRLQEFLD
ncbi:very short patch repair endonuclease [Sphingosinicella sp. LHD-64]|uniref:very short patch repair endonuclease n=1 Tax=Sphingosinicella sp. LHD-64 TaxID=3072139 RepID=UPI00280DF7F4|nr:very short patch repair endonuclease [Sphingosinicella sp. LHD-64]MDQ8754736.1 very short patch repair endonuclease [Sphingosinicella sp. LHD-64]